MTTIKTDMGAFRRTKWYEYAIRFVVGGTITAATGLIANSFGPVVGGLFLALPAIFPASATLIDKHEKQKVRQSSKRPSARGTRAAGLDAAGAAIGSVGLIAFAAVVSHFVSKHHAPLVLVGALLAWSITSASLWILRNATFCRKRRSRPNATMPRMGISPTKH